MRSLSCAGSVHDNRLVDGDALASAPSFSLLSPEARAAVAPHAQLIEVPEGSSSPARDGRVTCSS